MFLPYSTDAPVYYWPYATVGLIVVNTLLFLGMPQESITPDSPWLLAYGDGLRPDQWFGSRFTHGGFFHLLGNMVALWVFGLVVEGKLGPGRFLVCYLAVALLQAALEQAFMLGYTGDVPGSLGASAAIYGVMAMAAVWAPANTVNVFFWFVVLGTFEAPLGGVAGFYIGLDLIFAVLLGGHAATSILHVMGAALGFPLGVLLLKRGVVDCEGWDLFTRLAGGKQAVAKKKLKEKKQPPADPAAASRRAKQRAERDADTHAAARDQVEAYLAAGNPAAAAMLHRKLEGLVLEPATLYRIVTGLQAEERWSELAPLLRELIDRVPQSADALRVKLAHVCVAKLDRPGRALDLLTGVNPETLTDKQVATSQRITARAHAMQEEGLVELDDEGW